MYITSNQSNYRRNDKIHFKEIYFNAYRSNVKIINLVRKLGFKTNMAGYHL